MKAISKMESVTAKVNELTPTVVFTKVNTKRTSPQGMDSTSGKKVKTTTATGRMDYSTVKELRT